jgi:hypothetical protein
MVPPSSANGQTFASRLTANLPALHGVALSFDLRPEQVNQITNGNSILVAALDFLDSTTEKYSIRLALLPGSTGTLVSVRLEESFVGTNGGFPDIHHSVFSVPIGQWHSIRLQISVASADAGGADAAAADGPTESIYVDNNRVEGPELLFPQGGVVLRPNLLIGAVFGTQPQTGWTFRFDNVTADTW